MEQEEKYIKALFQQEFTKIVAVISKQYGLQHIELAEDIVGDTFLIATETWKRQGLPENPTAWLYKVAKRKTLQQFRRDKIFSEKVIPAIQPDTSWTEPQTLDFSAQHIKDSQLQMLFAICHPAIASESQIGLALRILCGFGIEEIAAAFISNKETVNKRLFRAKEKLRAKKITLALPPDHELANRLNNVLHIIYLLFNEGYYSKTQDRILQKELCWEALRLGILLTEFPKTNLPETNALVALMCFHASRFDARESDNYNPILYDKQDRSRWNYELIKLGKRYLNSSAQGNTISSYHLEAGIAFWHCHNRETQEKWKNILHHYDLLLQINYSPSVALNRTFALYKVYGKKTALEAAEKLQLTNNHFYFVLLGELHSDLDNRKARENFQAAISLAKTATEKQHIQNKINDLS